MIITQNTSDLALITAIKTAVRNQTKLSVVRCGDGEMHILKNVGDFPREQQGLTHHHSLCLIQYREGVWKCIKHAPADPNSLKPNTCECYLTDPISINWRNTAREIIKYSIANADYVGLTVPGRNANYYTIDKHILKRNGINKDLRTISSLFPREHTFGSLKSFKEIIQGRDIHIITPNVKRFKNGNIDRILGVRVTYTDISGAQAHNQAVRDKVKYDIQTTQAQIILFGGGYALKSLIPWASNELNKISLDVGSVLDAWSGLQSRHMFMEDKFAHLNWIVPAVRWDPVLNKPIRR